MDPTAYIELTDVEIQTGMKLWELYLEKCDIDHIEINLEAGRSLCKKMAEAKKKIVKNGSV